MKGTIRIDLGLGLLQFRVIYRGIRVIGYGVRIRGLGLELGLSITGPLPPPHSPSL